MGRCCLQTATASTLWFVFVACTWSPIKVLMQQGERHASISEWGLIYGSIFIPFGVTGLDTLCKPRTDLANMRPTSGVFTHRSLSMLAIPVFIYYTSLLTLFFLLHAQEWYLDCNVASKNIMGYEESRKWYRWGDNYDTALWFNLVLFYYPMVGYIYSFGYRFRRSVFFNIPLTVFAGFSLFLAFYLLWGGPTWLHCVFRINCDTPTSFHSNVPFFKQFSVGSVGACMYGPQLCQLARGLANQHNPDADLQTDYIAGGPEPRKSETLSADLWENNQCRALDGWYKDAGAKSLQDGWASPEWPTMEEVITNAPGTPHCLGPNNCFPESWKVTVTIVISVAIIATALVQCLIMRRHPGVKTHFPLV